jgi:hypothetical protein
MLTKALKSPLSWPLLWAIALHVFFFSIFPKTQQVSQVANNDQRPVEISTLSPTEFKTFRTLGVKGGRKEFSIPMENKISGSASASKGNGAKRPQDPQNFSISNDIAKPRLQYPSQKVTKDLFPSLAQPGMPESTLNIGFEPPEGVSETELNSTEKIYYGFSKRTYEIYITSLISSFNRIVRGKPYLDFLKIPGAHNLTGRIVFNQEGRAVDTQFFQLSKNEHIQQLFENTLMDIRSIPNPPKGLLNRDGTFAVHYRLQVGDQTY